MKLKEFFQNFFGKPTTRTEMTDEVVLKIIDILERARADEITCDDMFAQLDEFAEHKFYGRDVEKIAPLLREHLDICNGCHEEYAALLSVLENTHSKN